MLRRDPDAVLLALDMDRTRRELYVEGRRDRLFLAWLLGDTIDPDAAIREISSVNLPEVEGGERGRLLGFARLAEGRNARIRFFADADWDRLLSRSVPSEVWLTDYRDLEGYVLRIECVDKVLRLGIASTRVSGDELLALIRYHGRRFGLIRLMSELDCLKLPFQGTDKKKHISFGIGGLSVNYDGYLRALLQNARISLARLGELSARLLEVDRAYASVSDTELIHGKDAMCVVEVILSGCGAAEEEGSRLLWASFESVFVEPSSNLSAACQFLVTDQPE